MPEYLAPGVFVEETSFRGKSIAGVGTSVAGMVGPTRTGPLRGKPEVITSYEEYKRVFGDEEALDFGEGDVLNHTALAARAFFDNGGKQLYVVRTVAGVNAVAADGSGSEADPGTRASSGNELIFRSRFPGAMGNYTLEVNWRDGESVRVAGESVGTPDVDEIVHLEATGLTNAVRVSGITATLPDAAFPISLTATVVRLAASPERYEILQLHSVEHSNTDPAFEDPEAADFGPSGENGRLLVAGLVNSGSTSVNFQRVAAQAPDGGVVSDGTYGEIRLEDADGLDAFTGDVPGTDGVSIYGIFDNDGTTFTVMASRNDWTGSDIDIPVAALFGMEPSSWALQQQNFDINVLNGGEVIYTYGNLSSSTDEDDPRRIGAVMSATPERRQEALSSPVACIVSDTVGSGDEIIDALYDMFLADALEPPPETFQQPRFLIELAGGDDGGEPNAADFQGETDVVNGSTGFAALEEVEDVSIVMTPAATNFDYDSHLGVAMAMRAHCSRMRYRVGIVDSREGMSLSEVRDFRSRFGSDSRLALYYPWVVTSDPTRLRRDHITVPPAGFVAGLYARTDVERGVHKAPANVIVQGALRFAQDINRFQQELLNPNGVNCLRFVKRAGNVVWGARTLSTDVEWQYVNVRRYFLFLERSIETSTQWAVFEPNGPRLWDNIRSAVEDFLYNEWFNGRLLGASPKEAYFVRCDRSTMTQSDIDNGRMVCLVGVSPLRPAEFVIFRVGQKTADA